MIRKNHLRRSIRRYATYQSIRRAVNEVQISDAIPFSNRYNADIKKVNMNLVMYDACIQNRNITSVAMAKRAAEMGQSKQPRTPCGEEMMQLLRAIDPKELSTIVSGQPLPNFWG